MNKELQKKIMDRGFFDESGSLKKLYGQHRYVIYEDGADWILERPFQGDINAREEALNRVEELAPRFGLLRASIHQGILKVFLSSPTQDFEEEARRLDFLSQNLEKALSPLDPVTKNSNKKKGFASLFRRDQEEEFNEEDLVPQEPVKAPEKAESTKKASQATEVLREEAPFPGTSRVRETFVNDEIDSPLEDSKDRSKNPNAKVKEQPMEQGSWDRAQPLPDWQKESPAMKADTRELNRQELPKSPLKFQDKGEDVQEPGLDLAELYEAQGVKVYQNEGPVDEKMDPVDGVSVETVTPATVSVDQGTGRKPRKYTPVEDNPSHPRVYPDVVTSIVDRSFSGPAFMSAFLGLILGVLIIGVASLVNFPAPPFAILLPLLIILTYRTVADHQMPIWLAILMVLLGCFLGNILISTTQLVTETDMNFLEALPQAFSAYYSPDYDVKNSWLNFGLLLAWALLPTILLLLGGKKRTELREADELY